MITKFWRWLLLALGIVSPSRFLVDSEYRRRVAGRNKNFSDLAHQIDEVQDDWAGFLRYSDEVARIILGELQDDNKT